MSKDSKRITEEKLQAVLDAVFKDVKAEMLVAATDKLTEGMTSKQVDEMSNSMRMSVMGVMAGRYLAAYLACMMDTAIEFGEENNLLKANLASHFLRSLESQFEHMAQMANVPISVRFGPPIDQTVNDLLASLDTEDKSKAC